MADFVLSFVMERIHNLASEEVELIHGVSSQVDEIRRQLKRMQCFLKDADSAQDEGERILNWVIEIRDISYDAEDVLEIFVLKVSSRKRQGVLNFARRSVCLHKVGLEIKNIRTRISDLDTSLRTYGMRFINEEQNRNSRNEILRQLRRSYSYVVEEDFIGLYEDVEKLVADLVNEDSGYRVVSICGMGGLGKTTIAQKIYNHKKIKQCFEGVAWACISQEWQTKDVLQGILIKLLPEKRKKILKLREEELGKEILRVQEKKKCLVVIDDIWDVNAWDCLKHAFPIGKVGTKLVVTTRNKEVALHVDPTGYSGLIHEPRLLSEDESLELLQRKARLKLGGTGSGDEKSKEKLARKMVGHCSGLPLAVVVLGGILRTKHTLMEWEMVHRKIGSYIGKGKRVGHPFEGVSQVLALSYDDLPYHLKQCFLCLGSFPEDKEIEAEKIYQLWMAENMLSSEDLERGEETMMDIAGELLVELAHRCMVQIKSHELTGKFEFCTLHDLMRDLCLSKGKAENFIHVIDYRGGKDENMGISPSSSICKVRRISSYLGDETDKYISPEPEIARKLRSAQFFVPDSVNGVPMPQSLRSDLNKFKMLRVLDIGNYRINEVIGESLGKLRHLRYLSLKNSRLWELPTSIVDLPCLQTLDLRHCFGLNVPNVLWKIKSLQHLYLPDGIRPGKELLRLDGLSKLEVLKTFDTCLFDVNDLFKLTNLWRVKAVIKVKLEQELVDLINYLAHTATKLQYSSFEVEYKFSSPEELNLLEQLIQCHRVNTLHIRGVVSKLPEHRYFSPRLTTLGFWECELKEDPMVILEKLPNLKKLVLGWRAFIGKKMVCSQMGFPQLKILVLYELPNLEEWRVEEGSMPKLSSLLVNICYKLKMVPEGLRFISTLEKLTVLNMPREFTRRLKEVDGKEGEDLYKVRHVPSIEF